jgi:hypothetical protein
MVAVHIGPDNTPLPPPLIHPATALMACTALCEPPLQTLLRSCCCASLALSDRGPRVTACRPCCSGPTLLIIVQAMHCGCVCLAPKASGFHYHLLWMPMPGTKS